jgi:hypothetical protein
VHFAFELIILRVLGAACGCPNNTSKKRVNRSGSGSLQWPEPTNIPPIGRDPKLSHAVRMFRFTPIHPDSTLQS